MTPKGTDALGTKLQALAKRECRVIRRKLTAQHDLHEAVHEARKAVRRLRAILALVDEVIEDSAVADQALERFGDSLSTLRDANVAIHTADALAKHNPSVDWSPIVLRLRVRCRHVVAQALDRDPGFSRRLALLTRVEGRMAEWPWELLRSKHLRSALKRGQKRVNKAARSAKRNAAPDNMHRWRRRSRKLRMQLEVMTQLKPHLAEKALDVESKKRVRELRKLSDGLGWQQDVVVLRNLVRRMRDVEGRDRTMKLISKELAPR